MSYHREAQYMANMIEIVKADPAKKEDYKRIFENSQLYNHYFKKGDLLEVLSPSENFGKTFSELSSEEKNEISHRGQAMRCFGDSFNILMEDNK